MKIGNYRCDGQGVHATQDIIDRITDRAKNRQGFRDWQDWQQ